MSDVFSRVRDLKQCANVAQDPGFPQQLPFLVLYFISFVSSDENHS